MFKKLFIAAVFLTTVISFAGDPVIWHGSYGKLLPQVGLQQSDNKSLRILTVDPTAAAGVAEPIGSVGQRDNAGVGELWFKASAADTAWTNVLTALTGWTLAGNTGTTAGVNFLGTTDAQDVVVKANSVERLRAQNGGGVTMQSGLYQFGTPDAFAREQIWNHDTNAILRLGSWGQDGDATNSSSEGEVVYGNSLTGQPISASDGGYARVKVNRFGLYTVDSTLPYYNAGDYYFRIDDSSMFYRDNAGAKTFEVTRTTGQIDTSLGAGVVHSDASGILSSSAIAPSDISLTDSHILVGNASNVAADVPVSGAITIDNTGATTLHESVSKRYIDFLNGSDTATGGITDPWKTLQHAYTTVVDASINKPYVFYLSGGNNDTDVGTITGKPNICLVADSVIQVAVPLTISGGITNDNICFTNIIFIGAVTWARNDATAMGVQFNNAEFFSGPVLKQSGAGSLAITAYNSVTVNMDVLAPRTGSFFYGPTFLGTTTFEDVNNAAYYEFMGGYSSSAMDLSGGAQFYFSGMQADTPFGYSITTHTTANGTPVIQSDSGSIPPTVSGPFTTILTSFSQHESYTPTTAADWNTVPNNVRDALDTLATSGIVKSQSANTVLAAPNGSSGLPSFRALVAADIPDISANYLYKPGLAGGQTATGGTGASDNLVLRSTTNGTKGQVYLDETTTSTSTTTGALRVDGGVGIGENLNAGGAAVVTGDVKSKTSFTMEDPGAGTNTIKLVSPTAPTTHTVTLPGTVCASGQTWTDNGSGVMSCTNNGGISNWALDSQITLTGTGTNHSSVFYTRKVGTTLQIRGYVHNGTVTGTGSVALNLGTYTIDSTQLSSDSNIQAVGWAGIVTTTTQNSNTDTASGNMTVFYDGTDTNNLYITRVIGSQQFVKSASNSFLISDDYVAFRSIEIPVL